jgi:hypothetical protein
MAALRKHPKAFAAVTIVLVTSALVLTSWLWAPKQSGDWAGICVHSLSANDARLVSESGAGWIRIDCYDELETAAGNAHAYGLKVLAILDSWTMNNQTVFTLAEWRSNVTYYVSKYADYVDGWEIWNEPASPALNCTLLNLTIAKDNEIIAENMSQIVNFYYSMVQTASPIIRQYDPTAKIVLFGGLNLYSGTSLNHPLDENFAGQLATENIQQYGDAISVHAYPWNESNSTVVTQNYAQALANYSVLFPALEVWVTETGKPIHEGGEAGQAQYLAEALKYFHGKVAKSFWYSLLDNTWDPGNFGLIGNNTTPRPAYSELQKSIGK